MHSPARLRPSTIEVFRAPALAFAPALALAMALPASAARGPIPVSPGAVAAGARVEARCPTFQWSGTPGASGYELAVLRLSSDGAEPVLVTRTSVPGDARGFTPSSTDCLERGGRYAWSVAATGRQPAWSAPLLFEVEVSPSLEEVEQAIATLERYRSHGIEERGEAEARATPGSASQPLPVDAPSTPTRRRSARAADAADQSTVAGRVAVGARARNGVPRDTRATLAAAITRIASAASTPTLGTPSLGVSANVSLGPASNLFKDDDVFLWDDTDGNTALGRQALASVLGDATNNTAVGRRALQNTTGGGSSFYGSSNTAIGDEALRYNTTGFFNTASGHGALRTNSTGSRNTATGYAALRSNTTGYQNTANGYAAMRYNTTGTANTASGFRVLYKNVDGNYNTASGYKALYENTNGERNIATGFEALVENTEGSHNSATGFRALQSNTTGEFNTASGFIALSANTEGDSNTAFGYYALGKNTTGRYNTAIGPLAGSNATTGDNNIFIGTGAYGVAGEESTIRIGGTTVGTSAGQQNRTFINGIRGVTVANAATVLIDSNTGQLGTLISSRELKQDIQDLGPLADRLLALRPVAFRYRQHAAADPDSPLEFGLLAEEVAEVFPELVVFDEAGKPQTVKYHLLSSLLLGELQRQEGIVREQNAVMQRLDARLEAVEGLAGIAGQRPRERGRRGR